MLKTSPQSPPKRVFVHLDAAGAYMGNGGFLTLSQIANRLANMGYTVSVFDTNDALTSAQWDWCDLGHIWFDIARWGEVIDPASDAVILTSWLANSLDHFKANPGLITRMRYWCHDELLRKAYGASREFIIYNPIPVAVTNRHWCRHYQRYGIRVNMILPLWVRDIFTPQPGDPPVESREQVLGFQMDVNGDKVTRKLWQAGISPLLCHGTQREVAAKMKQCRFFLQWNEFKDLIEPGEGWGLSAYEAAQAGCIPLVRKHPGNAGMPDAFRFDDLADAVAMINAPRGDMEVLKRMAASVVTDMTWTSHHEVMWRRFIEGEL